MKTPISYYGGKQNLISELLPMIPPHVQYVEPFCGGAALFWAKPKSEHEVINDSDLRVANFWLVLRENFDELQEKIKYTLHHEESHKYAYTVLKSPIIDKVEFAWAFWVQTNMSFANKIHGGFAFNTDGKACLLTAGKKDSFTRKYYERLKHVEIFSRDAIDLIRTKDHPDSFMYFDPPYPEGDCGHYEDKKDSYYELLEILPTLKCKWLMSSYPSGQLTELRKQYNWDHKDLTQPLQINGKHNAGKTKTECLTYNYQLPQLKLFQ